MHKRSQLVEEKSAAESALNAEKGKLLAEQEKLLSVQRSAYAELLGELKLKEAGLKNLRKESVDYQFQLQAQKAWHAQTLSAQKSTYTKLQGDLQQTELSKLRKELAKWQSANEGPHELKVY